MAYEKKINTRIGQKHDISANWSKAINFIPKNGEIIVYDDLHQIKIGDGSTKINDLTFVHTDWNKIDNKPSTFKPSSHEHQASQVKFADGQTFQQKLDNDSLKGPKGDTGPQGLTGEKGATGGRGPAGQDGAVGPVGPQGPKPIKGKDYWTSSDINTMATEAAKKVSKASIGLDKVNNTADSEKSVKYATTAGSAKASDVYDWAKAVSKPGYTPSEIGAAPASHSHNDLYYTQGQINGKLSGKSNTGHHHDNSTIDNIDAGKITSGTISIDRLPQGALERLVTVANQTARFKLTASDVQLGDTVKQLDTGIMYIVTNTGKLNSAEGYTEYTAGSASSVPWSGVTGKPDTFIPSSHNHNDLYYTQGQINEKLNGKFDKTGGTISGNLAVTGSLSTGGKAVIKEGDSRLTNSRPASDVYDWAKASTKPKYNASEVGALSTSGGEVTGVISAYEYGNNSNNAALTIDKVGSGSFGVGGNGQNMTIQYGQVNDRFTGNWSTSQNIIHEFKGALKNNGKQVILEGDNRLTNSRPASDVYSWAKASTKPSYTKSDIGLGNVDNTADSDKNVNNAHALRDAKSGTEITAIYSNHSFSSPFSYMTVWDGYCLTYADKATVKNTLALNNVENKSSATIRGELSKSNITTALGYTPPTSTEVNTAINNKMPVWQKW